MALFYTGIIHRLIPASKFGPIFSVFAGAEISTPASADYKFQPSGLIWVAKKLYEPHESFPAT